MSRLVAALAVALSTALLVTTNFAQQASPFTIPNLIRYGGVLKNAEGATVSSSTVGVTFAIYKQQDGGAAIWMETQNVTTDASGSYSVLLGSTSPAGLPGDLFSQQEQRWLGVQVQGEVEQPRVLIVSVPYAFKAHEAETLGGRSATDFVLANGANSSGNSAAGNQVSSTTSSSTTNTKTPASDGPTQFSGSTTNQIVSVTQTGTGWAVNATAPTNAIVGTATATTGTTLGVQGIVSSPGGYGVYGLANVATGGIGVKGNSNSTSGTGVRGTETSTSGATTGVSGYVASTTGTAGVFNNAGGGKILSGQNTGVEKFSVDGNGNVNAASAYQIAGNDVVAAGNDSLFLGVGAGSHTTGRYNAFCGDLAGATTTVGASNTFTGYKAGFTNTTGTANSFYGWQVGFSNITGLYNTFAGDNAGYNNTTGSYNNFFGHKAGYGNTVGQNNTFLGQYSGYLNTTGSDNAFFGESAGYNNTTGGSDVYIGNPGPSSGTESNTIRIGRQGTGQALQNSAYIAGIYGSTTNSGVAVVIDSTGKLGTQGGAGLVTSFNGRTGAVLPATNDYGFSQLHGTVASAQLVGTYSERVILSNTLNAFTGDGSGLTGVPPAGGSDSYIQNRASQQATANFNISGNGTVGGTLSGSIVNTGTGYFINGSSVLNAVSSSILLGAGAGAHTTGIDNTFAGYQAGAANTTGTQNTFSGDRAGDSNVSGAFNSFYGHKAGYNNTTGSSDVYIANQGPTSGTESNTIRIGTQGTGLAQQNATYIAGIFGATSASGVPVYVNSDGLLGTLTSSLRYKEQVRNMGDSTNALMKLRPVTFLYKPEYANGDRSLQYGLIAEEVAQVYPELVAYDNDGQPYTVRYQYLTSMLLNEVQKQYHRAEAEANVIQSQQDQIKAQEAKIGDLEQRLSRLESLIGAPVKAADVRTADASRAGDVQ